MPVEEAIGRRGLATTPWPIVFLAIGAGVVGACQLGKATIALPAIRADLAIDLSLGGWVLSMFSLIGVACGMAMGGLAGRWGDRRAILLGLLLIAAASLAGAAAPGIAALLATRFVEGIGFLLVTVAVPSLIARLARAEDLRFALGAWGAYMPVGQAAMILVAPLLLAPFGWRGLWLANAALVLLFALVIAASTRHVPAAPPRRTHLLRDLRDTVAAPGPRLLAITFGCYSLQYLAVMGFLPTILVEREGLSAAAAGPLTALAVAANGVGNIAAGLLLQRGWKRWRLVVIAALAMGGAALAIFLLALPLPLAFALYLAFSGIGGLLPGSLMAAVPRHAPAPHLVPATNGLLVQCSNLGMVVGPPLVGALAEAFGGWGATPLVVTTAALAAALLALALRRREAGR